MEPDESVTALKEKVRRLGIENTKLRKKSGGAGLETKNRFSHEEIIFLFARLLEILGLDSVKEIRGEFPDCIAVKEEKEVKGYALDGTYPNILWLRDRPSRTPLTRET